MLFGYIRVSTAAQNPDRQLDALSAAGCARLFVDRASGARADRPELSRLFDLLRPGDTVVITELSRFGRSVRDLIDLTGRLEAAGANLKSLKEPFVDTATPEGRMVFTVLSAVAQFERELIVRRTAEGLAAARARGRRGGRPPVSPEKIKAALALYDSGKLSVAQLCKQVGISAGSLYKYYHKFTAGSARSTGLPPPG